MIRDGRGRYAWWVWCCVVGLMVGCASDEESQGAGLVDGMRARGGADTVMDSETSTGGDEPILALQKNPIQGGTVDTQRRSVVGLYIDQGGGSGSVCTGTLVAPNLVVTAWHCVAPTSSAFVRCGRSPFGPSYPTRQVTVTTAVSLFGSASETYGVREIVVPSDVGNDICGFDIAMLILDRNVPSSDTLPYGLRLDAPAQVGERYTAVGFGNTSGSGGGSGTRRQRSNRQVTCVGTGCPSFSQVQATEFEGTDGTCSGDSGGPALAAGDEVLGVLSRGPGGSCAQPTYSAVYPWRDFIRRVGARAQTLGGYAAPYWLNDGSRADSDGDGVFDSNDNCPNTANTTQSDVDGDGQGDVCDSDSSGGGCTVCNTCAPNSDCGGEGLCVNFGAGGICTVECPNDVCPGATECFQVGLQRGGSIDLCLNADAPTTGVCPSGFTCEPPPPPPATPTCEVCQSCGSDSDCPSGRCSDFGTGGVCTPGCSTGCPTGTACFVDPIDSSNPDGLCLNADAVSFETVCPASFTCEGATAPAPPPPVTDATGVSRTPVAIPDNDPSGGRSTIEVSAPGLNLSTLTLAVDISHTWRGDLELILISPSGQVINVLAFDPNDNRQNPRGTVDVTGATPGQPVDGTWTLVVVDRARQDTGTINAWGLGVNTEPPTL